MIKVDPMVKSEVAGRVTGLAGVSASRPISKQHTTSVNASFPNGNKTKPNNQDLIPWDRRLIYKRQNLHVKTCPRRLTPALCSHRESLTHPSQSCLSVAIGQLPKVAYAHQPLGQHMQQQAAYKFGTTECCHA